MASNVLIAASLVGCAYSPGSFKTPGGQFAGHRTTVGCIDLAIERRPDLPTGSAVLGYQFGNRCNRPATIDLAGARVMGRTLSGEQIALAPFDPDRELRPLRIDGRMVGSEAIAYPIEGELAQLCIDAASVAHEGQPRWLCFSSDLSPAVAEVE